MGLVYTVEVEARMEEIEKRLSPAARQRVGDLAPAAAAERAAGIPPTPGSTQALYQAAISHMLQLSAEFRALLGYQRALRETWGCPKMPKQTPPWEEVEAALCVAEPTTPAGSGAPVRSQRGSSSDESAVPAGDTQLSEAAQLLPSGAGLSAPGLRWRQGHEKAPP